MTSTDRTRDDAARLDTLEAHLARLDADLHDLAALLTTEPAGDAHDVDEQELDEVGQGQDVPEPAFATLDDWVEQFFTIVFTRPIGGTIRWCTHWRDHPEAVLRIEALWRSWETLRLDPNLGIATWLVNYLDPQLAVLLSASGTFHACTADRHTGRSANG